MTPLILCALAFGGTLWAARRSIGSGLVAAVAVGYVYGIVRANILSLETHLLFDFAVAGLYLGAGSKVIERISNDPAIRPLAGWATALIIWPTILFFVPGYDPLFQLVGLRGNAFLLPFLLIGATLHEADIRKLAVWLSVFNLLALALAVVEFLTDVRLFYPMSAVTRIIYMSNDVAGNTAFRIPASFPNAHAYAGTMVMTLPVLVAVFGRQKASWWRKTISYGGILAAFGGVFIAATRTHAAVLFWVIAVVTLAGGMSKRAVVGWTAALVIVAVVVQSDARLQRFASILDSDVVETRFSGSVNDDVIDIVSGYPLGNGLAGGGTSIPYFLTGGLAVGGPSENEYARISVEQGTVGLVLWASFIIWFLTRVPLARAAPWFLGRIAAWAAVAAYFGTAFMGTGLLTSVPQTSLMLVLAGWVAGQTGGASAPVAIESTRPILRPRWRTRGSLPEERAI